MKKRSNTITLLFFAIFLGLGLVACNLGKAETSQNESAFVDLGSVGEDEPWTKESVKNHIKKWKKTPKSAAIKMIDKYGVPNEITDKRLVWVNKGDFSQTMITNVEINHDFPMPHKDCLMQTVKYDVPVDKYSAIAAYDGSVILERTKGTMSARCDDEAANYLALNLTHDIVKGKKSIAEARKFYGETIVSLKKGEKPAYTQKLMFKPQMISGDKDERVIDKKEIKEIADK